MTATTKKRWKEHWTSAIGAAPGASMVMMDAGPGIGWGVLRRRLCEQDNDLREFVWTKLTHGRGPGFMDDWHPTATHIVLLPDDAPTDLLSARRLAERYEDEAFGGIKDLACVAKINIGRDANLLSEWHRIVAFAHDEFAVKRSMACIAVLHIPAKSGVRADSHAHLIAPAREVARDGFGSFVRPFASDAGGPEIARAWKAWS